MTDTLQSWDEDDSRLYQQIASVAVPAREEQIATLLSLLPFGTDNTFHAVEIGSGEGFLSATLLKCFPDATVTALDGSANMRKKTATRLAPFKPRGNVEPFNLFSSEWHTHLKHADCVLSSLCLHHLSKKEKQTLYATVHQQLSPAGALLIADLIEPQRPEAQALFAATWDRATKQQSIKLTGGAEPFETFKRAEWNLYIYPDPVDKPSPLFNQLLWLKEAGFSGVDCFWMQAGHAIYGGYKTGAANLSHPLFFEFALEAAQNLLSR